jgi:hypothetical protein
MTLFPMAIITLFWKDQIGLSPRPAAPLHRSPEF